MVPHIICQSEWQSLFFDSSFAAKLPNRQIAAANTKLQKFIIYSVLRTPELF